MSRIPTHLDGLIFKVSYGKDALELSLCYQAMLASMRQWGSQLSRSTLGNDPQSGKM